MKKILNINIIMALAALGVIGYFMVMYFPLYQFHTLSKQVRYDMELEGGDFNNAFILDGLSLYLDDDNQELHGGELTILGAGSFVDGMEYKLEVNLNDDVVICDYQFDYEPSKQEYQIGIIDDAALPQNVDKATATIYGDFDQVVAKVELGLAKARLLDGYNRNMRMENVTLTSGHIRLGQLITMLDLSGYDSIALEYRYLISDDLDKDDNNSYKVFEKIEGTPEEILDSTGYGTYDFSTDQKLIASRPLSVAVIMKKGDETNVVKIDLD